MYHSTRRELLRLAGTGVAAGLAGCFGDGAGSDDGGDPDGEGSDDEPEVVGSDGLVYAFTPDDVAVVDPETAEVVDRIEDGIDDERWADPRITADHGEIYVVEESLSQAYVFDTGTRELVSTVDVGPGANHLYHPTDGEIWVHADDEGAFYVVDVDEHAVIEIVETGLDGEGHGKLLHHEALGSTAYATNVADPGVAVVDLDAYERVDFLEFGEVGGTHYKAFAPDVGLLYAEYATGTVVVDTATDEVIRELPYAGAMFLSPDERLLAIVDGETVTVLDATSDDATEVGTVDVDGGPTAVRFSADGDHAFAANPGTEDVAVLDLEAFEVADRIDAGAVDGRSRPGVLGGDYVLTSADVDGTVTVIDATDRELVGRADVGEGVGPIQYVGDSGVGYTGR